MGCLDDVPKKIAMSLELLDELDEAINAAERQSLREHGMGQKSFRIASARSYCVIARANLKRCQAMLFTWREKRGA